MIIKLIQTVDLLKMCEQRPRLRADLDPDPIVESIRRRGFIIDTDKSHMIRVVNGVLVDGERRIVAAGILGIDWLPVELAQLPGDETNVTRGPVGIPEGVDE